jgi:hypothetical protein
MPFLKALHVKISVYHLQYSQTMMLRPVYALKGPARLDRPESSTSGLDRPGLGNSSRFFSFLFDLAFMTVKNSIALRTQIFLITNSFGGRQV